MAQFSFSNRQALASGYSQNQINEFLAQQQAKGDQYQLTDTPQSTPQASMIPTKQDTGLGDIRNWYSTLGGIGGGIIGAPLGPAGIIAGSAIGSGLGEAAKQATDDNKGFDVGSVFKEGVTGGIGGGVGMGVAKVAGKVAEKVLPKVGESVVKAGENMAIKPLRATPSQLTKFKQIHGEDVAPILSRNNIIGQDVTGIQKKAIDPLQEQFNTIANNTTIPVSRSVTDTKALNYIGELLKSPSQEDHQLAEKLFNEYDFAINKIGDNPTLALLNKARQTFDDKVSDWKTDPIAAGKNRLLGNIFRQSIQETADKSGLIGTNGKSLKDMGIELSKLYGVKDIAARQENLGRGSLPVGLTTLLGFAGGGGIGGLPGAVAGAALVKAVNSPIASTFASKGLRASGELLKKGVPDIGMQLAANTTGQVGARALLPTTPQQAFAQDQSIPPTGIIGGPSNNTESNNQQNNMNHNNFPSSPQQAFGGNYNSTIPNSQDPNTILPGASPEQAMARTQSFLTGYSPQELYQSYTKAFAAGDKAAAAQLKNMYNDENAYQKQYGEQSAKPVSATQQARNDTSYMINQALSQLSNTNPATGPIAPKFEELKSIINMGDSATIDFDRTISGLKASIAKARAGTAFTPNEEKLLNQYTPSVGDSKQQIVSKLTALQALFNSAGSTQVSDYPSFSDNPNSFPVSQ